MADVEDKHNHCIAEGTLISTARGEVPIKHSSWRSSPDATGLQARTGCVVRRSRSRNRAG